MTISKEIRKLFRLQTTETYKVKRSVRSYSMSCELLKQTINKRFTGLFDDSGQSIYEGDTVEIHDKIETKVFYISRVFMMNDVPMVCAHPAHIKIGIGYNRRLIEFCDFGIGYNCFVKCKLIN